MHAYAVADKRADVCARARRAGVRLYNVVLQREVFDYYGSVNGSHSLSEKPYVRKISFLVALLVDNLVGNVEISYSLIVAVERAAEHRVVGAVADYVQMLALHIDILDKLVMRRSVV